MSRVLIIVLSMLFVVGCAQLDHTATVPTPTATVEERLRSEMCDAIMAKPILVDDFRRWITSDARISLYWENTGSDYLYPTPGDSMDDWMRGIQIWALAYEKSAFPLASRFVERWAVVKDMATGYLRASCEEGRDAWIGYSPDTSGCDVWHSELDRGTLNAPRILDGFYSSVSDTDTDNLLPRDLGFISIAYVLLSEISIDALLADIDTLDYVFEAETAMEMSINAVEIASTLCGFEVPERMSRTEDE